MLTTKPIPVPMKLFILAQSILSLCVIGYYDHQTIATALIGFVLGCLVGIRLCERCHSKTL